MPRVLNRRRKEVSENSVYVGRPTKWGNPFIVGVHGKQGECVELYRNWIVDQKDLIDSLSELTGKDLICWCSPKSCHADVLLELSNRQ